MLRRLQRHKSIRALAEVVHFTSGVISALSLVAWRFTGDFLALVFSYTLLAFFHAYEFVEWFIVKDNVYEQLVEFYVGYSLVFTGYLAYLYGGGF